MAADKKALAVAWAALVLVILLGAYVLFQKPSSEITELSGRVDAVQTDVGTLQERLKDADGNDIVPANYVKWADSLSIWADSVNNYVKMYFDWIKEGRIPCDKCPIEGSGPPGGGPRKPNRC